VPKKPGNSSRCREIWKFSWHSARSHRTSEITRPFYVLNPDKGFEAVRKGTNGFHTLVARTGDDSFRGTWPLKVYRDDILYPISFDEAGAKAQMRVFFDAAEMQAKGIPPKK